MVLLVSALASGLQEPFNHFQSFSKWSHYTSPISPLRAQVKEWPGRSWLEEGCPVAAGQSWRVGLSSPWCCWVCAGLQAVGKNRHILPILGRQHSLGTFRKWGWSCARQGVGAHSWEGGILELALNLLVLLWWSWAEFRLHLHNSETILLGRLLLLMACIHSDTLLSTK